MKTKLLLAAALVLFAAPGAEAQKRAPQHAPYDL